MSDKNVTINILPEDPTCWFFIMLTVVLSCVAFSGTMSTSDLDIERERTRRIEMLMEKGYTNAVIEELRRDLKPKETEE